MKKVTILLLVMALLIMVPVHTAANDKVIVSSKSYTEPLLLGNMTVMLLKDAGTPVKDKVGLGPTSILRKAMKDGSIDLHWEYTGTVLTVIMKRDFIKNSEEAFQKVKKWDLKNNNYAWLDYAEANNSYCLVVREEWAKKQDINSISDLADYVKKNSNKAKIAVDMHFYERPDGLHGLEEKYNFKFRELNVVTMEIGLTYSALKNKQVDIAMAYGTDGRIVAFDFRKLEDNKNFFPVYNPAPVIRKKMLKKYPQVETILQSLTTKLDTETLQDLNKRVDVDGESVNKVAEDFLKKNGLL